jgi:hypothetical protein
VTWFCQDCAYGPVWARRAAHRHGRASGHQLGGSSGPDQLTRWWWLRLARRLWGRLTR